MAVFEKNASPYQAFHAVLWDCAYRLGTHTTLLQEGLCDPHRVHQARVALRRLRTARKAFAPLADDKGWRPLIRTTRKIASHLGQIRDLDVLSDSLLARLPKADAKLLAGACAQSRSRHCHVLVKVLQDPPGALLLPSLFEALRLPLPEPPPSLSLRAFADQSLHRLHRQVAKLANRKGGLHHQHALRKRIKELRYAIEFFSPLYSRKPVQDYLTHLTGAQNVLGNLIDHHASAQQLGLLASEFPEIAPLRPALHKRLDEDIQAVKARLDPALKAVRYAPPFWRD
ncbi:MAG: CHAD domain-containing protein [Betaproteobacteria bacterium]|nr:CHAD domain-containing protein [Betaproteobacteria bacterium]MDE1981878.1 CHAD domain-containing protein [Betaproteobacteria bacterium]